MLTNLETSRIHHKDFICNLRSARRDVVNAIDAFDTNLTITLPSLTPVNAPGRVSG
jgi:hypothetical protein